MTLRAWLAHVNTTQSEFAESIGVSVATVSRWCTGDQSPRIEQALAVERITGGEVPCEEWEAESAARVAR